MSFNCLNRIGHNVHVHSFGCISNVTIILTDSSSLLLRAFRLKYVCVFGCAWAYACTCVHVYGSVSNLVTYARSLWPTRLVLSGCIFLSCLHSHWFIFGKVPLPFVQNIPLLQLHSQSSDIYNYLLLLLFPGHGSALYSFLLSLCCLAVSLTQNASIQYI